MTLNTVVTKDCNNKLNEQRLAMVQTVLCQHLNCGGRCHCCCCNSHFAIPATDELIGVELVCMELVLLLRFHDVTGRPAIRAFRKS